MAAGGHRPDGRQLPRRGRRGQRARRAGRRSVHRGRRRGRDRRCRNSTRRAGSSRATRSGPEPATSPSSPALTREEALEADPGRRPTSPSELVADGARCLLPGDMGIANTTPSAALVAVFTGTDPAQVTGRGTGIDDATLPTRSTSYAAGSSGTTPDPADPIGVLAAVGGLEHAALTGFLLGAAAARVPGRAGRRDDRRRRAGRGRPRAGRPAMAGSPATGPSSPVPRQRCARSTCAAARPGPPARRGQRCAAGAAAGAVPRRACCARWRPSTRAGVSEKG